MNAIKGLVLSLMCLSIIGIADAAPAQGQAVVTFVRTDSGTQGNWKGVYGTDGSSVADTTPSHLPSYATFVPEGQANWTWTSSGTESRDLQVAWASPTNVRQASCWYSWNGSYDFNVNFTDGNSHQLALYALDWDSYGGVPRAETIQVVDATTNAVLDTRSISNFTQGIYLIWNISGHVKINVIYAAGANAVISAAFFGPATPPSTGATATAGFIKTDTNTQGNWHGTYGADGYSVDANSQSIPSYASFGVQNDLNYTWTTNTTDVRALQSGQGSGRVAAVWYNSSSFNFDVNFTDGKSHQFALYALDWDSYGGTPRVETVQIVDAGTTAILDTRSISNSTTGVYLVWNVSGHVKINVIRNAGANAVVAGVFFGGNVAGATVPSAAASLVNSDIATGGNWQGTYGADGYSVDADTQSIPTYATFTVQNQLSYTWTTNTTDPRGLQSASGTGRVAACWYNDPTFDFDLNITDGKSHQIAFYAVDWDSYGGTPRGETIQITDANTSTVLDSKTISNFANGIYLIWNISGHVKINVTRTAGANALVNGVFFGTGGSAAPPVLGTAPSTPTGSTQTTQPTTALGQLTVTPGGVNFGSVNISSTATQSIVISNTGSSSVTISSVTVSGPGFNASGVPNGTILQSGQSTTLLATFTPASTAAVTGGVIMKSSASNSSLTITFSGTGVQAVHAVSLTWAASTSGNIVGYDIYRGTVSSGPYALLTPTPITSTSYTDSTGQPGQTYYYVVTAVDSSNTQSGYSNVVSAIIQ